MQNVRCLNLVTRFERGSVGFVFIFFWLCVWGGATPADAKTYYVSANGKDSNVGSLKAPFATIQKAADLAIAGDIVNVSDGTYAGFQLERDGNANGRILFKAIGNSVVINRPSSKSSPYNVRLTSFSTIEGFSVINAPRYGIRFSGTEKAIIRNCKVSKSVVVNIYGGHAKGTLIEGNDVSGSTSSHGIYVANSSRDVTVRFNRIHDNKVAGIHLNGDRTLPPGDGVIRDMLIERNTIYDNGQNGINMDGTQQITIRNNLIYNNALNGIRSYVIDGGAGPQDLKIINNTIFIPSTGGWCIRITDEVGPNLARNNILINAHSSNGSIALDKPKAFTSEYNLTMDRFTLDRGSTILSLKQWQARGYGKNSLLGQAANLFLKSGSDFHLKVNAPAIDRGSAQDAPPNDLDGKARPQGKAVDLGCYEWGQKTPPPDAPPRPEPRKEPVVPREVPAGQEASDEKLTKPEESTSLDGSSNDVSTSIEKVATEPGGIDVARNHESGPSPDLTPGEKLPGSESVGDKKDPNSGCGCSVGTEGAMSLLWCLFILGVVLRRRRTAHGLGSRSFLDAVGRSRSTTSL